ncbi:general transcriptional corepressor trfA-like isoform X2 [Argiope bruennichi]|nr:general transcriptional corepressor trfA-like isoform X2 [Argiope bruennichi]
MLNLICLILALAVPFSSSMEDDAPRPVIISLPINVAMPSQRSPSYEPEESAEEQPREQRIVPRTYNPFTDNDYPQEENQDSNNNNNNYQASNNFLPWNPGNRFMVLQISDFVNSRNQQPTDSEEQERVEDTRVRKQRKPSQGTFDFEDYRVTEPSRSRSSKVKKQRSSSSSQERKMKTKYEEPEEDEEDGEVYGTDPVVHYLKEKKRKSKKKNFDFSNMRQDDDDEFTMRDWWSY